MKSFAAQLAPFIPDLPNRRNVRLLLRFLAVLGGLVILYSIIFHILMVVEGQNHSWITGFYWTLTVMSTLGFGDITFQQDAGRAFSIIVLLSGMVFLLILLPFTFIEFFYAPWIKAQAETRAPRTLPAGTEGHILLTHEDPVSCLLIQRLEQYGYPYALVVGDLQEALRLHDLGTKVVFGEIDRPETYRALHADRAALIVATGNDRVNTNIAFTVREISSSVPIVTTADNHDSVDILSLAGSSFVLQIPEVMGRANARRIIGVDARAHFVGRFDELFIAEATIAGTPLVGKTLAESRLREHAGVSVVGLWKRGQFEAAKGNTLLEANSVMLMAGSQEQFARYNELFCIYHVSGGPVLIVGAGRVGRATANALTEREVDYRIIEIDASRIKKGQEDKYVHGSAADAITLERAGFRHSPAVVITAHDDDTNIYLTLYCRRLRPDIQIVSRATRERNISTLYRAGADFVLSYASMGTMSILEFLQGSGVLMVAEGLHVCETEIPEILVGRTLAEAALPQRTGCNVVALRTEEGLQVNPDSTVPMPRGGRMIFIAASEAEKRFLAEYGVRIVSRKAVAPLNLGRPVKATI